MTDFENILNRMAKLIEKHGRVAVQDAVASVGVGLTLNDMGLFTAALDKAFGAEGENKND